MSHVYDMPGYREPLSAEWNIRVEAEMFVRLYRTSPTEENLEKIRRDLTMTAAHYRWLLLEFPRDRKVIGRIMRKRQQTLNEIERLVENVKRRNGDGRGGTPDHRFMASKAFGSPYRNGSRNHRRAMPVSSGGVRQ